MTKEQGKYQPTPEEMRKAEESMTVTEEHGDQQYKSVLRERTIDLIARMSSSQVIKALEARIAILKKQDHDPSYSRGPGEPIERQSMADLGRWITEVLAADILLSLPKSEQDILDSNWNFQGADINKIEKNQVSEAGLWAYAHFKDIVVHSPFVEANEVLRSLGESSEEE